MDELTRERFEPRPVPVPPNYLDELAENERQDERRRVLLGADEDHTPAGLRARALALARSRRLSRAIKAYEVNP